MKSKDVVATVKQIWADIETWYKKNAPNRFEDLLPGAKEEEISQFESRISLFLPEDYRASLKIHNGEVYVHSYNYLNLDGVLNSWSNITHLSEQGVFADHEILEQGSGVIQNTWWDSGWIPFAEDSGGNMICLDLNPADDGVVGQILYMDIQEGPSLSEFKSFLDWLKYYRDGLHIGKYEVDEEGYIVEK